MNSFKNQSFRYFFHLMVICIILPIPAGHAQTVSGDSVANAILPGLDYSQGRIVPGFGFTLDQYLEEQIKGNRELASAFGLLFHPSKQITLDLFSAADAKRVNFREYLDYPANPISSAWHLESRMRIANAFEIKPFYSKTKSEERYNTTVLENEQNISEKGEFVRYGLGGTFLSRGGFLQLTPAQRIARAHLNGCLMPVGTHQWLVHGILMHQKESQSGFGQLIGPINGVKVLYQKQTTQLTSVIDSLHIGAHYGFKDNFQAGLHAGGTLAEDEEKNGVPPNYTRFGAVKTLEWFLDHDSNIYWPRHFLQITSLRLTHHEEKLSDVPGKSIDPVHFDPHLRFSISLYKLPDYPAPSAARLLTETSGIFQNRLPAGKWMFGLTGSLEKQAYGSYQSELTSDRFSYSTLIFAGKMTLRTIQTSADFRYGITNLMDIRFESAWKNEETRADYQLDFTGIRLTGGSWRQSLQIQFANFQYHPSDEARFGWNALDNFQKQFMPMLGKGMVKGTFRADYLTYDKDFQYQGDIFSSDPLFVQYVALLQNLRWNFQAGCDWGIARLITISGRGAYSVFQSGEREFGDEDWEWVSRLTWQPFSGFRVELNYQAIRYTNYFKSRYHYQIIPYYYEYAYQYYDRTVQTWNIRLLSLF